jgi:serine/threonine protein kinase
VELGRGGFGVVYRATQVVLGQELRDVALKLFHEGAVNAENVSEKMNDAISLIRVLDEIEETSAQQHFINIHDLGVTADAPPRAYIAMELVRGGDLQQRLRDYGKFNAKRAMDYLLQITRAIGFMHTREKPMIHRDIKPDNLLVVRRGGEDLVKVADFGLAAAVDGIIGRAGAGGALAYMAPEGFEYSTACAASDVYSIGLVAYELLFGEQPFARLGAGLNAEEGEKMDRLRQMHVNSRRHGVSINPEDSYDLDSHPRLVDVLNTMLAHDVDKRYADAQKVHEDLKRLWEDDYPEEAVPAEETAEEILARHRRKIDYCLRHERYAEAQKAVREMTREFPTSAESYLAQASVSLAQADVADRKGRETFRDKFLTQAASVLIKNIDNCQRSDRPVLMRSIADVYRKLGDPRTAAGWIQKARKGQR